jgi:hypothetical protein
MKHAAEDLHLDGRRIVAKVLREYLKEHWPPGLGEPSNAKLAAMTTFLRYPEHEKGGLFPGKKRGRNAKR